MKKKLAILGAGGHGSVVSDAADASGWNLIEFFDDFKKSGDNISKWSCLGTLDDFLSRAHDYDGVHLAFGDNKIRSQKASLLRVSKLVSIVHPSAIVSPSAKIGAGACVMAGVVINANVTIGIGSIVNTGAKIDHDCFLGDFSHVCPGVNLAGGVKIGEGSFIGIGSSVIGGISIGENVIIGAGSTVVSNIQSNCTAFGNPCSVRKSE